MSNPEILARLTAGSVNPAACGGRSSSRERLMGCEVAGSLKGLSQDAMDYTMAVYMCDEASRQNVIMNTERQALRIAERGKWKIRPSQIRALAEIAANEAMNPNKCKLCNGTGKATLGSVCKKCGGLRMGVINFAIIARAVKVEPNSFGLAWKDKFLDILDYVLMVNAEACKRIAINTQEIDEKRI